MRPQWGLPKFRKNVSLRLDEETKAIVATDRRGRSRTFTLDGTERAPTEMRVFGLPNQGVVDGAGNLLAIWENGTWDTKLEIEFCSRAQLGIAGQDDPTLPPMRADGLKLYDINALSLTRTFSAIGAIGFAGTQLHVGPPSIAAGALVIGCLGSVIGFIMWKKAAHVAPKPHKPRGRR